MQPELLLIGWNEHVRGGRTRGSNVSGVVKGANRNVLVLKDNGLNEINRILVPTAGGPHARLGMRVAHDLATEFGAAVTAMTVQVGRGYSAARSEFDHESLHFFQDLAEEYSRDALRDAGVTAETSTVIDTDVSDAIVKASADYDLVIIGASNEWRLRQWVFGRRHLPAQVPLAGPSFSAAPRCSANTRIASSRLRVRSRVSRLSAANGVAAMTRKIAAAPRWKSSGTPASRKVAAICSISPIQRPESAGRKGSTRMRAQASGWLFSNSRPSSSKTPSRIAVISTAAWRVMVPLVSAA